MKVSLVIPAYNEEQRLPPFLDSIVSFSAAHREVLQEVIVVNDGSTDKTAEVASAYEGKIPGYQVMTILPNQGKGAAVQAGVMAAVGGYVVFMDADGATEIDELPKMINALQKSQIGIGNRWMKGAETERHSFLRAFSGWSYRTYMRLFGLGSIDTMCGFKGYHRNVARDLFDKLIDKRWLFDTEIAYKAVKRKYTITNFPIRWESKDGSKLKTSTLVKSALHIWPLIRSIDKQEAHSKK